MLAWQRLPKRSSRPEFGAPVTVSLVVRLTPSRPPRPPATACRHPSFLPLRQPERSPCSKSVCHSPRDFAMVPLTCHRFACGPPQIPDVALVASRSRCRPTTLSRCNARSRRCCDARVSTIELPTYASRPPSEEDSRRRMAVRERIVARLPLRLSAISAPQLGHADPPRYPFRGGNREAALGTQRCERRSRGLRPKETTATRAERACGSGGWRVHSFAGPPRRSLLGWRHC